MLDYDLGEGNVHVGPSDYVPWLTDRKWAYIRMEGTSFGDVPLNIELKLEVWDSPNSAGIVIDAVRMAKLALNNGVAGALEGPSSYLMKSPPKQIVDDEAYEATEQLHRAERAQAGEGGRDRVRGPSAGRVASPRSSRPRPSSRSDHVRMPSWASISSKPRLTSSSVSRCERNGSTSISPASQRSTSCGTSSRPLTPPNDEPATRRPVIRKRGTTSSVSPLPATPRDRARAPSPCAPTRPPGA